jgi:hypothetical protein
MKKVRAEDCQFDYKEFKKIYSFLIGFDLLELLELKDQPLN